MTKKRNRLFSFITSLVLILSLLIPSVVNAKELLQDNIINKTSAHINVGIYGNDKSSNYEEKEVELQENDTPFSVLKRVIGEDNIDYDQYGNVVILNSIFNLKDSSKDGWIYAINREQKLEGINAYTLKDGDELIWHYDTDKMNPQLNNSYRKLDNFLQNVDGTDDASVTISVEKRVLGQDDIVKPRKFGLKDGQPEKASYLLDRLFKELNIEYGSSGSLDSFYLSSVGSGENQLSEKEHGFLSGWMYSVNGVRPNVGMSGYTLKSGDIIRIQYTAQSFGEDIDFVDKLDELKNTLTKAKELDKKNYTQSSYEVLSSAIEYSGEIVNKYNEIGPMLSTKLGSGDLNIPKARQEVDETLELINESINQLEKEDDIIEVPDDFENDLWLQYDFKEMNIGDSAEIYPRRIPQIVGSSINNDVHRPNFNFEIVNGDSIKLSTLKSSDKTKVEAVKPGTTIVKVTYDETSYKGRTYGACSKVNTAYVVYSVIDKENDISISTNIDERSYDTIYYTDKEGVDFNFELNTTNADNVKVTLNGEILKSQGNKYTAKLKNRSNIIGVEAINSNGDKKSYYKIVDARKIEIDIENKTTEGKNIYEGDTVKVSFKGISNPVAKLATIYNPTFRSSWGGKGTFVEYTNDTLGTLKGYCSQWDLATKNSFEVKFDKKGRYNFSKGKIFSQWWGDELGSDKNIQGQGNPNTNAVEHESYFSSMPDFNINVLASNKPDIIKVSSISLNKKEATLTEGDNITLISDIQPSNATNKNVIWISSDNNILTVDNNGKVTAAKPGKAIIKAVTADGNFEETCTIIVDDKQFIELKEIINEVEKLNKDNYEELGWNVLLEKLDKAKDILNSEISTTKDYKLAKEELEKAKNNLVNLNWKVVISPEKIAPGTEVTVKLPNMKIPSGTGLPKKTLKTIYKFNMPGFDGQIESENGASNSEEIKEIKFTIGEDVKPGTYTMSDGYVNLIEMFNFPIETNYYKNEMPNIDIVVTSKNESPIINASNIELKVGDKFEALKNVSAIDKEDGNIIPTYEINDNNILSSNIATKPGSFKVVYTAKDSNGSISTKSITVTIKENTDIIMGSTPEQISEYKEKITKALESNKDEIKPADVEKLADGKYLYTVKIPHPSDTTKYKNVKSKNSKKYITIKMILNGDEIKPIIIGAKNISTKVGAKIDLISSVTAKDRLGVPVNVIVKNESKLPIKDGKVTKVGTYLIEYSAKIADIETIESKTMEVKSSVSTGGGGSSSGNSSLVQNSLVGDTRYSTAVKVSNRGWSKSENVLIVNSNAMSDALSATPFAKSKNAPILLTEGNNLNIETKNEITRLQAKNVYVIGGTSAVSENVVTTLKSMGLNIERICGNDRYQTSLEIAKKLENVSKVALVNGVIGLPDAVSIAPVAANENMPILLSSPTQGTKTVDIFIKNNNIKTTYIVGGKNAISSEVANKLLSVTRLGGKDRNETNLVILETFYKNSNLNNIFVAKNGMNKQEDLIDALAVGVLAAKEKSPVVIVGEKLSMNQEKLISLKQTKEITKVGGNGNENAFSQLVNILKK